jgi:hypothetical protein
MAFVVTHGGRVVSARVHCSADEARVAMAAWLIGRTGSGDARRGMRGPVEVDGAMVEVVALGQGERGANGYFFSGRADDCDPDWYE